MSQEILVGPDRMTAPQRRDLMEIVEDRYQSGSTVITSQLPVDTWHDVIDEPTFADAILDRVRACLRTNGSHALTPQRAPAAAGIAVRIRRNMHLHGAIGYRTPNEAEDTFYAGLTTHDRAA